MVISYSFQKDPFPTKFSYYFINRFQEHYEVSFSRDEKDYLKVTVSFCVTNDEYENDQYAVTNKGDVYRVLNTVCLIILSFSEAHPNVHHYVFSGERRAFEIENKIEITGRTRVFLRFVRKFFNPPVWEIKQEGNFVHLLKKQ